MGAMADAAIAAGGRVHGVLPHFMRELEWGHDGIHRLELVEDMRDDMQELRKELQVLREQIRRRTVPEQL